MVMPCFISNLALTLQIVILFTSQSKAAEGPLLPSVTLSGQATTTSSVSSKVGQGPNDRNTLNCTAPLPMTGYPAGGFRTDWNSMVHLCGMGCFCTTNLPPAQCQGTFGSGYNFSDPSSTLAKACAAGCACQTPNEISLNPPAAGFNATPTTASCPTPIPQSKTINDFRNTTTTKDITCFPEQDIYSSVYTLVTSGFDPTKAQICSQCPDGIGPDPQCKKQPVPLPSCDTSAGSYPTDPTLGQIKRSFIIKRKRDRETFLEKRHIAEYD